MSPRRPACTRPNQPGGGSSFFSARERPIAVLGQAFVEEGIRSLSEAQVRHCPYHRPDWTVAARLAIDWWRERGREDQLNDFALAVADVTLSAATRWAAESFFAEPIWINGQTLLGNGQHRVCAMKLASVPRCLVET